VAFGNQTVNTASAAKTVTLTNTGPASMALSSSALTGTNLHQFAETTTCGSSLSAGSSCVISITFAPTVARVMSAFLTVTDNAPGSPHNVSLSGNGVVSQASMH